MQLSVATRQQKSKTNTGWKPEGKARAKVRPKPKGRGGEKPKKTLSPHSGNGSQPAAKADWLSPHGSSTPHPLSCALKKNQQKYLCLYSISLLHCSLPKMFYF